MQVTINAALRLTPGPGALTISVRVNSVLRLLSVKTFVHPVNLNSALTLTDIVNNGLIKLSLTMYVRVNAPLNLYFPLRLTGGGAYPPDSYRSFICDYF